MNKRTKKINQKEPTKGDCVIYCMSRDHRIEGNFAFTSAVEVARERNLPLLVLFVLYQSLGDRIANQFIWMINGLKEVFSKLDEINVQYVLQVGKAEDAYAEIVMRYNPAVWFFDFSPLRNTRKTQQSFANNANFPVFIVDTHNIVPVWEVSEKAEIAARIFRPKILRQLGDYQSEYQDINQELLALPRLKSIPKEKINWERIEVKYRAQLLESYKPIIKSGRKHGLRIMSDFIQTKLVNYPQKSSDPSLDGQSGLSAYLHFGQISALEVVLAIKNAYPLDFVLPGAKVVQGTLSESIAKFLNELIVWKELAENFCYYNPNYDNLQGAPAWAIESLNLHASDGRAYLYSLSQLEAAQTHDPYWNAAQKQMLTSGKMHGYMRMYWAKKILEWTSSAEQALKYAIYLNDKYELDGYDPRGYAGCMWAICGVHDHGWTERPIFGKIRYMNAAGLKRKFNIEEYSKQYSIY